MATAKEKEIITIVNAATGEVSTREMTAEEITAREELQAQMAIEATEREAKATARASALAKLAELGLTEEEIQAL